MIATKGPGSTGSGEGFLAGGLSAAAESARSSRECFLPVMRVLLTEARFADNFRTRSRSSADLARSASRRTFTFAIFRRCSSLALEAIAEPACDAAETEEGAMVES